MKAFQRIEAALLRAVVLALAVFSLVQIIESGQLVREYAFFEGPASGWRSLPVMLKNGGVHRTYSVTVALLERKRAPAAALLVNGVEAGRFKSGELTVQVQEGDLLEIDAVPYRYPLRFRVVRASDAVAEPLLGTELEARGEIKRLGKVRLREY